MLCSICTSTTTPVFKAKILSKYTVQYFSCPTCGFVQTEEPYWLQEAYQHTLNDEDTGVLQRNWHFAEVVSGVIFKLFDRHGKFLDFGGGHGVFTRLMRDKGFNFYWADPNCWNIFARGFEYDPTHHGTMDLVTSIECFEHFAHPLKELETLLAISSNIFFVTQLTGASTPRPVDWDYYAPTHGQHISFYSIKTLHYIARKYTLNFHTNGSNIHLFTRKRILDFSFNRALHPGPLVRRKIRIAMKSRHHADYKHIVQKKNGNDQEP
jgi:hypothetical protein